MAASRITRTTLVRFSGSPMPKLAVEQHDERLLSTPIHYPNPLRLSYNLRLQAFMAFLGQTALVLLLIDLSTIWWRWAFFFFGVGIENTTRLVGTGRNLTLLTTSLDYLYHPLLLSF